jgi:hypothetical protein
MVHETPGLQAEIPAFGAQIPGIPDGDELGSQPMLVFFSAVGEMTGRQSEAAGQMMEKVECVPAAFPENVDAVFSFSSQRKVGLFFNDEILGFRLDHPLIIKQFVMAAQILFDV